MVCVWAARLATFLYYRAWRAGDDWRLRRVYRSRGRLTGFWLLQALVAWATVLPVAIVNAAADPVLLQPAWDAVGLYIWWIGWVIETIADWQKVATEAHGGQRDGRH